MTNWATPLLILTVAIPTVHILWFLLLPHLLTTHKTEGPGLRRYLRCVVATPSLFGDSIKCEARHDLMRLCTKDGLHAEVVAQGRAILRHPVRESLEVEVRWRLANALEGLGQMEEAAEERRLASLRLKSSSVDPAWYIHRGRLLEDQRQFAAACEAYEAGLELIDEDNIQGRTTFLAFLMLSSFNAGRIEESARYAEELAALTTRRDQLFTAHRQAGAAYGDLGRLDESETHRRTAVEMARELGNPEQLADSLAELAELLRKRGKLVETLSACDEAAAIMPTRQVALVRYEALASLGRFAEALVALARVRATGPLGVARLERFLQGAFDFAEARMLAELGRPREALDPIQRAREGVAGDAKVTLWCDALEAVLFARLGRRDEALLSIEQVEARLDDFPQDRNTRLGVFGSLGRATLALGDFIRSEEFWEQYLDCDPSPVDRPTAAYHLGECRLGLGDPESARARYREAADSGLDTHYARLARSKLRGIVG